MPNKYWEYWKCETTAPGRQTWKFQPPAPYNAFIESQWQSEEGRRFLEEMATAFAFDKTQNPNTGDRVYRFHKRENNQRAGTANQVLDAALNASDFYESLQAEEGYWPGDYGGPLFLTPGLIIAAYITQTPLPAPQSVLIKKYMLNHQNADGGWGLHIEGASTMFGTVMQYLALRILGLMPENLAMIKARKWIKVNGGATGIPSWGKFYLALLGVYDWQGLNSLFPEMWLFPKWLPFHPTRYWCHTRMVYLPMAYCCAHKITMPITPLTELLREELYTEKYEVINWEKACNSCADKDLYNKQSTLLKLLNKVLNTYEHFFVRGLRNKACKEILENINAEDEHTNFIDIGPVNQAINSICVWHAYGADSQPFKKHVERWFDYMWVAEDGMKMNGYNGSQLWDTVFAAQAIMEGGFEKRFPETLAKAYGFIERTQIKEEVREPKKFNRHPSVGGWPFSTSEHGWPITDCTAEGLKTLLRFSDLSLPGIANIPSERFYRACDLILSLQNKDGGWASYELTRGPKWLELLNPSEIFGNIMIDYSYTECTSACIQSLIEFRKRFRAYKKEEVERAINKGVHFIMQQQRNDGSWYGSWAVCFTYGTWFAVEGLTAFLHSELNEKKSIAIKQALQKASQFLLERQNADGGWGESFESCIKKQYVPNAKSQIVNTAWALLSLMAIDEGDNQSPIGGGIKFLLSRQLENGDFPQESISGVFNHSCAITYTSYRNVFPIWALGRYLKKTNKADIGIVLSHSVPA
jgi:squalene/oxidosqualene cyclase-like protein